MTQALPTFDQMVAQQGQAAPAKPLPTFDSVVAQQTQPLPTFDEIVNDISTTSVPEAQTSIGTGERLIRGGLAETFGDIFGAIPMMGAYAAGAVETALGQREEGEDIAAAIERNAWDGYSDDGSSALINFGRGAKQLGYDMVETEGYKRDIDAMEGEEGYIPVEEELAGLASLALPIGWLGLPGKISKLPKLARPAAHLAELATPGSYSKGNFLANVALGVGMTEGGRALMDETTMTEKILSDHPVPDDATHAATTNAAAAQSHVPAYQATVTTHPEHRQDDNAGVSTKLLAAGGAASLGMSLGGGILRGGKFRKPKELIELETAISDSTKPLIESVRREAGDEAAATMEAVLKKNTYVANDNVTHNANLLGVLDDEGNIRAAVPLDTLEKHWKMTDPTVQQKAASALIKGDILEQIRHAKLTQAQQAKYGKQITDMRRYVKAMERDAEVGPLMQSYKRWTDDYASYRHYMGMITDAQFAEETMPGRYYVPTQYDFDDIIEGPSGTSRFLSKALSNNAARSRSSWLSMFEKNKRIGTEENPRAVTDERLNRIFNAPREQPIEVARAYSTITLQSGRENRARIEWLRLMQDSDVVEKITGDTKFKPKNVMQVVRKGNVEQWEIKHDGMFTAAKFRPHFIMPGPNALRRWVQRGSTGNLNPAFAPTSLLYDATMGILTGNVRTGNSGLIDSLLDAGMRKAGIGTGTRVGIRKLLAGGTRIPDAILGVIEGIALGASGRMAEMATIRAARALNVDPNDAAKMVALRTANDKFYGTVYGQMQSQGYMSSRFESEPFNGHGFQQIDDIKRRFVNTPGYRLYDGVFSTIRDAYRVGMFARTAAGKKMELGRPLNSKELMEVSSHVRNIAVDTSKAGENAIVTGALSSIPYGNVTTQTLVHLIRSLSDPATMSVMASTLAIAAWAREDIRQQLGEQALEDRNLRLSEYDQIASIPMRLGDEIVNVPLGIEWGGVTYALDNLFRDLFYDKTFLEATASQGIQGTMMGAMGRLVNISTPPVVDIAYAATTGSRARFGDLVAGTDPFRSDLKNSARPEQRYYDGNSGIMTDRIAEMSQAGLGVFGGIWADAVETTIDQTMRTEHGRDWFHAVTDSAWHAVKNAPKAAMQGLEDTFITEAKNRYPAIWKAAGIDHETKDAQFSPLSERVYQVHTALEKFDEHYKVHVNGALNRGDADYRIGPQLSDLSALPAVLPKGHPLATQMQDAALYFQGIQKSTQMKTIQVLRKEMESFKANGNLDKQERIALLNEYNTRIQDNYTSLLRDYGAFEFSMQAKYGPEWTLDGLARDMDMVLNNYRTDQR